MSDLKSTSPTPDAGEQVISQESIRRFTCKIMEDLCSRLNFAMGKSYSGDWRSDLGKARQWIDEAQWACASIEAIGSTTMPSPQPKADSP